MDENTKNSQHITIGSDSPIWFDRYGTVIVVLIGFVLVAGAIYFGLTNRSSSGTQATATSTTPGAVAVNIANVKTAGEPYIGDANAPVTMALFFDYQCPFCKQFDQTVLPQLYTNYVQTHKLKIVFKDFDFIGPDSETASEYARAVWTLYPQDFYTWYTTMYASQGTENGGWADAAAIQKILATIPGINVNSVVAEVAANKTQYDNTVQADFSEGQSYGIQGTPSVLIGTTLLQGAQTYQTVSALIDAQLNK